MSILRAASPNATGVLRSRLRQPFSAWQAFKVGALGSAAAIPLLAHTAARSPRGSAGAELTGGAIGAASFPVAASFSAAVLSLAFPALPAAAAAWAGAGLALYPALRFEKFATRSVRMLSEAGRKVRRLELGGDYTDTETAQQFRVQAVADMSAAAIHSRRFLGQEARFFHGY